MCPTSLKYETAGFRSKSALHLELMRGTLLLALFIFVHRNKNEPKNARPAKLAPLKQYRGWPARPSKRVQLTQGTIYITDLISVPKMDLILEYCREF